MACATLKRSLDWESLNQRPTKRRRCHPFAGGSPSSSQNTTSARLMEPTPSPFLESSQPKLTPGEFENFACVSNGYS